MRSIAYSITVLLVAFGNLFSPSLYAQQMLLAGNFAVNPSGAATYSVPIEVPPGIAGLQPGLALSYNSQGGNGLLGMGWGLSGMSMISRCPRTLAQDGVRGSVNYDNNDRYCLDGQRLVLVSGMYGAAGSEYRTEIDSQVKVIAYGSQTGTAKGSSTSSTAPQYFKVWSKNGQIIEYGNTADSRIEAEGTTVPIFWLQNRISDRLGNYMDWVYLKGSGTGVWYPAEVRYTGNLNTNSPPQNKVVFVAGYTTPETKYRAGSIFSDVYTRLTEIQVWQGSKKISSYRLNYSGDVGLGGSYDGANVGKPFSLIKTYESAVSTPTKFKLRDASFGFRPDPNWSNSLSDSTFVYAGQDAGLRMLDLNGDGLPDLLHAGYFTNGAFGGGKVQRAFINTGSGFVRADSWVQNLGDSVFVYSGNDAGLQIADLNADGLPDLLHAGYFSNGELGGGKVQRAFINTGSGFVRNDNWVQALGDSVFTYATKAAGLQIIDLNADGRPDLLQAAYFSNGELGGGKIQRAFINNGNGFTRNDSWVQNLTDSVFVHSAKDAGLRVIDLNGDSLPDLLHAAYFNNGELGGGRVQRSFINTGDGFVRNDSWAQNMLDRVFIYNGQDAGMRIADVNADGLPDLLQAGYMSNGEVGSSYLPVAFINKGNGFYTEYNKVFNSDSVFVYKGLDTGLRIADFNNDGYPDFLHSGYFFNNEFLGSKVQRLSINNRFTTNGFAFNDPWTSAVVPYAGYYDSAQRRYRGAWGTSQADTVFKNNAFVYAGKDTGLQITDLNGDGFPDLLHAGYFTNGEFGGGRVAEAFINQTNRQDTQLAAITIEAPNGTQIINLSFAPLTDKTVYTKGTGVAETYPRLDLQPPIYVVSKIETSDGVGGKQTSTYKYGGLKYEMGGGRGSLGFAWQEVTDTNTGIVVRTDYKQDYPFIGMPSQVTRKLGTQLLAQANFSYDFVSYSGATVDASPTLGVGKRYRVFGTQSTEKSWDLNGAFINATRTTQTQLDDYNNVGSVLVESLDASGNALGYRKQTLSQYDNDAANWILGRLRKSTVTNTVPSSIPTATVGSAANASTISGP